jgi:phosphocarrier protein HPr
MSASCRATVRIVNRLGMHARPAAHFVRLASRFVADVYVSRDSVEVNGKSIMGVMMLAAEEGARIELRAEGEDAEQALAELVSLIERGFDEDEEGRPVKGEGAQDG